mgnify:FL=1
MRRLVINGQELKIQNSPTFLANSACPLNLKLHYVDKIDERYVRVAAERGKTAHGAIADLTKHCLDEKMLVQDLEDGMLTDALQRHISPRILSETTAIYSWLRLWRERFKLPKNIHGIEERVALDDDFDECDWKEASYRGIIDLQQVTDTHAVITDWKSQFHILSQAELDAHEQGTMYCWLMWKQYPHLRTFTFRIWYLRYGFYHETTRTEEDLEVFEKTLMIREKALAALDNWDPVPGPHCQYCDFIHLCPIAQDLSPGNPEIITQEQATLAAQRLVVLDVVTKGLKEGLKNYVDKNDSIRLGDKFQYGYRHSSSLKWKAADVEQALRDYDRDLSEVANVDVKAMKKLIKTLTREEPALAERLEDLAETKHRTEFRGYKPGAEDDEE